MVLASGDPHRICEVRDGYGRGSVLCAAVAHLTAVVAPPAPDGAIVPERTGVRLARRDMDQPGKVRDPHWCWLNETNAAVTEHPTDTTVAPAPGRPIAENRAGVIPPGRDREHIRHVDYGLHEGTVRGRAGTEPTTAVGATAPDRPIKPDDAGVSHGAGVEVQDVVDDFGGIDDR